MSPADLAAILPLLVTAYGGVAAMLILAFRRGANAAFVLTVIVLLGALGSVFAAADYAPRAVTPLITVDTYSLYFTGLILAGAVLVTLMGREYVQAHSKRPEAYYVLLLLSVLGMAAIASSSHLASFFLALETASVSLYGLIGYTKGRKVSIEAAVKYLVLAASSSAFLLFGFALIYSDYGTIDFAHLAGLMQGGAVPVTSLMGLALALVGFGFKLAFVPFHTWSPDVYQGAPAPVTALIATGSKGAVFALLLRLFEAGGVPTSGQVYAALAFLAVATMLVGNLLALLQSNVKRLLAYSSVSHLGYLLIPLIAGDRLGPTSAAFYLAAYFPAAIAAFGVVTALSAARTEGDTDDLADYHGLAARSPLLAAGLAVSLLSLTGIPLTAGFIGKFYIFAAAIYSGLWGLVIAGIVGSGISAFYYLRVLAAMYARPPSYTEAPAARRIRLGAGSATAVIVSCAAIIVFGVYPTPLIRLAEMATVWLGF